MRESPRYRVSPTPPPICSVVVSLSFSCRFSFVQLAFRWLPFQVLNADSFVTRSDVLMTTELPLMLIGK